MRTPNLHTDWTLRKSQGSEAPLPLETSSPVQRTPSWFSPRVRRASCVLRSPGPASSRCCPLLYPPNQKLPSGFPFSAASWRAPTASLVAPGDPCAPTVHRPREGRQGRKGAVPQGSFWPLRWGQGDCSFPHGVSPRGLMALPNLSLPQAEDYPAGPLRSGARCAPRKSPATPAGQDRTGGELRAQKAAAGSRGRPLSRRLGGSVASLRPCVCLWLTSLGSSLTTFLTRTKSNSLIQPKRAGSNRDTHSWRALPKMQK